MFDKNLEITGKHGEYIRALIGSIDANKNSIFKAAYAAYKDSAIIGYLYGRKAEKHSSQAKSLTIFLDQLSSIRDDLEFNYRLIMLLDKKHEPDMEKRLRKAFNDYGTDEAKPDERLFEQYSLGGIEVLYEKIIENSNKSEDYLLNLFKFVQEFNSRYNEVVKAEDLVKLCRSINVE